MDLSTQQGIPQAEVGEAEQTKAPQFCLVDGIPDGSELEEHGTGRPVWARAQPTFDCQICK